MPTTTTMPFRTSPAQARPRLLGWVNRMPSAAITAPTAANGIRNQLPQPRRGISARIIHNSASTPHNRLITPMPLSRRWFLGPP
ncbi:hypothetical protein G6F24_018867 [Rhizopus arrhizus]|nr:hypothetical protein G6F24_018867 [Rhizopus arrhizus]